MKHKARLHRWPGVAAVLFAATALALAGCSGGSTTPQVASLATSAPRVSSPATGDGGSASARQPASGVTPLLNQWAACERGNGDPDQADPTVDANRVIWVIVPRGAQPAGDIHDLTGSCSEYLAQAQNELRAGYQIPPPIPMSQTLKYVACMRASGVPDYPYPTGDTTDFNGSGVDPNSPLVQRVNQLCGEKLGWPAAWINPTTEPGSIEVRTAGMPLSPTAPACFFQKVDPCTGDITKSADSSGPGSNG